MMALAASSFASGAASLSLATANITPEARERRLFADYAECIVRLRPMSAENIVLQVGTVQELRKDYSKVRLSTCVPGFKFTLYMWGATFQFALADAFVRSGGVDLPDDATGIPSLSHAPNPKDLQAPKPGVNKDAARRAAFERARAIYNAGISAFGECVIRKAPSKSAALLKTQVASDAERAAIRGLSSEFTACVDKGSKVALTPDVLRGSLALNYMRLAKAAQMAPNKSRVQ